MSIQDWKDLGGRQLLGSQGMRTYRYGEILCSQGYQQEDDAGEGTYGMRFNFEAVSVIQELRLLNGLRQVRNEIAVLKRVSMGHQNILTLVDYFETMNNRTLLTFSLATQPRTPH